jgi:hypothetical protein
VSDGQLGIADGTTAPMLVQTVISIKKVRNKVYCIPFGSVLEICDWLGGTLSGPKRPIFRHTSQIFFAVALLRPTKTRFVWQKMAAFLSQTRPR